MAPGSCPFRWGRPYISCQLLGALPLFEYVNILSSLLSKLEISGFQPFERIRTAISHVYTLQYGLKCRQYPALEKIHYVVLEGSACLPYEPIRTEISHICAFRTELDMSINLSFPMDHTPYSTYREHGEISESNDYPPPTSSLVHIAHLGNDWLIELFDYRTEEAYIWHLIIGTVVG